MKKFTNILFVFLSILSHLGVAQQISIQFDPPCVIPNTPTTISIYDSTTSTYFDVFWIIPGAAPPPSPNSTSHSTVTFSPGTYTLTALDVNNGYLPIVVSNNIITISPDPFYINCNNVINECEGSEIDLINYSYNNY